MTLADELMTRLLEAMRANSSLTLRPLRTRILGPSLPNNVAPKHLYHYTTATGLIGIASSRSLWASHAEFLNDKSEGVVGRSAIRRELEARESAPEHFKAAITSVLDTLEYKHQGAAGMEYYVCSFSEVGDDLGQWRGYGHGGLGVSIGLRWPQLLLAGLKSGFILAPVVYDAARQQQYVSEVLDGFATELESCKEEKQSHLVRLALTIALSTAAATFKDAAFAAEREWRLYQPVNDLPGAAPNYRDAAGAVIPYFAVKLPDGDADPIGELIVGPVADQERMFRALEMMCFRGPFHPKVSVRKSVVPLR